MYTFCFKQGSEGAIPRCKPFKYTYEKEIVMYVSFLYHSASAESFVSVLTMIYRKLYRMHRKALKDKSGVDKIIVKNQPYQLLNTSHEFFPSFDASNFHKLVNESS